MLGRAGQKAQRLGKYVRARDAGMDVHVLSAWFARPFGAALADHVV
jgi:hypothetical protein